MLSSRQDVAKAYIIYRNSRTVARMADTELMRSVRDKTGAVNVENSNANVDEHSFSGREKEASAAVQKALAFDFGGMSEEASRAHKEMLVYQHDADKIVVGETNCLFVDFEKIFKEGFSTRNGTVRPPSSFSTACQLVAVVFQCQSQNQFGGVASIHLDFDLAPFVKKSFYRHFADGMRYIGGWSAKECEEFRRQCVNDNPSIEDERFTLMPKVYDYAVDMLEREGQQAAQGLYHNLNTLESRQG